MKGPTHHILLHSKALDTTHSEKSIGTFQRGLEQKVLLLSILVRFGLVENIGFGQVTKLNNPMENFGLDFGPSWPFQSKIRHIWLNCLKWPAFGTTRIVVKKFSFPFFLYKKDILVLILFCYCNDFANAFMLFLVQTSVAGDESSNEYHNFTLSLRTWLLNYLLIFRNNI